jgi:hypothetical protein
MLAREQRIPALVETLNAGAYRVPPVRGVYIPKPGQPWKQRPLGIPEVEDRLLQAAVHRLLQPIYEANFLNASYGFRPGRSPHGALEALVSTTGSTRAHPISDMRDPKHVIGSRALFSLASFRVAGIH